MWEKCFHFDSTKRLRVSSGIVRFPPVASNTRSLYYIQIVVPQIVPDCDPVLLQEET
jgi:hypothetical protein